MLAFDASSIVYAWDNYPPRVFPRLWDWIWSEISVDEFGMCEVALDEVARVSPDCYKWLREASIKVIPVTSETLRAAKSMKDALGIVGDRYGEGVGENDLLIVASALTGGNSLVSEEKRQPTRPANRTKYKIPSVCALPGVEVECLTFLDVINGAGVEFG